VAKSKRLFLATDETRIEHRLGIQLFFKLGFPRSSILVVAPPPQVLCAFALKNLFD
jgi:hypothetical protein